jgi:TolB protein
LTRPRGIAKDVAPDWSPDGTQIAFERIGRSADSALFVMKADGTKIRQLAKEVDYAEDPAWSPDGATLAFSAAVPGSDTYSPDLYLVERDGSGVRNLTHSRVFWDLHPRWSPNGRTIAFESSKQGLSRPDIHVIRVDGTRHVNLAKSPNYDAEPEWSPDGRSIVFASTRDGSRDIYVMTASGRNQTNLTFGAIGTRNARPAYSP